MTPTSTFVSESRRIYELAAMSTPARIKADGYAQRNFPAALGIIEAQAKRIAELEKQLKEADQPHHETWAEDHRKENGR